MSGAGHSAAETTISVGNIIASFGVAIGPGAHAEVRIYRGSNYPRPNYRNMIADILTHHRSVYIGREPNEHQLTDFAATERPGYLLIEAPAGYGKSALMSHLVSRHESAQWGAPMPRLLYFFIQQQGKNNTPVAFLQATNGQLLHLLSVEGGVPRDLESLRSQFSQLWSAALDVTSAAQPLLLFVDGLDEQDAGDATIASLLPVNLHAYTHVIVSSRPNPHPQDLVGVAHPFRAADVMRLQVFNVADIQALLQEHGATQAVANTLAVDVLALTHGEPLFARFVAQEIASGGKAALTRLSRRIPSGVEDYFRQAFDLLRRKVKGKLAQDILGMLTVAGGGMTAAELADVLRKTPWDVTEALERIQRFLIGNERLELMHLQLRSVVGERLGVQQQRFYQHKLLEWCQSYQQRGWPAVTPGYILRNYPEHLRTNDLVDALYTVVLDPAFRRVQVDTLGDISQTLDDLRAALALALDSDDVTKVVACAGAYRDTLRRASLALSILERIDQPDFDQTLKHARLCDRTLGWTRVMWLYLAWCAALIGKVEAARHALANAAELSAPQADLLCSALLTHTARALAVGMHDARFWLAEFGKADDAEQLLQSYRPALPAVLESREQQLVQLKAQLDELERLIAAGDAEGASMTPFHSYDVAMVASQAANLGTLLIQLAAESEGQAGIDRALELVLANPYPRYRDLALVVLGIAILAVPTPDWAHPRMRRILGTALDREGVSFTFDLPAMLVAEYGRRGLAVPSLGAYLQQALDQNDRWGTRVRALSAQAAARFCKGDVAAAGAFVIDANHANQGYAGFATINLLSLANRWWDLGQPDRNDWPWNNHVAWASDYAARIRADAFRDERQHLVHAYRSWEDTYEFADIPTALGALDTMLDRDLRLAYVVHLSARWACPSNAPNMDGLKRLIPLALSDGTTIDAVLARWVGLRLDRLSQGEVDQVLSHCASFLAIGRPWELGWS